MRAAQHRTQCTAKDYRRTAHPSPDRPAATHLHPLRIRARRARCCAATYSTSDRIANTPRGGHGGRCTCKSPVLMRHERARFRCSMWRGEPTTAGIENLGRRIRAAAIMPWRRALALVVVFSSSTNARPISANVCAERCSNPPWDGLPCRCVRRGS